MFDRIFKTKLMGYSKKEVDGYLTELAQEMTGRLKQKENEIEQFGEELREFRKKLEEIDFQKSKMEKEKNVIASLLVKAEIQAKEVVERAELEAMSRKFELEREIEMAKKVLFTLKTEIERVKKTAIASIESSVGNFV